MKGLVYVGENLNVVLNHSIDTTSRKNYKKPVAKLIKTMWEEMGFFLMSGEIYTHFKRIILTFRWPIQFILE